MSYSVLLPNIRFILLFIFFSLIHTSSAFADKKNVRCDVYPKGSDHSDVSIPCTYMEYDDSVTINRSDNVVHYLTQQKGAADTFKDQNFNLVHRQNDLGKEGVIFRFKKESIYLYWDTSGLSDDAKQFDMTMELLGVNFQVSCPNDSSLNTLVIKPSGLKGDNSVIKKEIDGTVTNAEVADLNADGSPEIYVYINSAGSGSYGDVIAYSANNNKSLSQIYLPPLSDDKKHSKGYMGHDEFNVVEYTLVRRFPLYQNGDSNSKPTGGKRDVEYKLVAGEASWQLRVVNSSDF